MIGSVEPQWPGIPVMADIDPVLNFEFLSFTFNEFAEDGLAYSWLVQLKDQAALKRFQSGLLLAI